MLLFLKSLFEIETVSVLVIACWFYADQAEKNSINYYFALYSGASLASILCTMVKSFFKWGETQMTFFIPFWIFLIISFFAHIFLVYVFKRKKERRLIQEEIRTEEEDDENQNQA